jgi:hypothetical protein
MLRHHFDNLYETWQSPQTKLIYNVFNLLLATLIMLGTYKESEMYWCGFWTATALYELSQLIKFLAEQMKQNCT